MCDGGIHKGGGEKQGGATVEKRRFNPQRPHEYVKCSPPYSCLFCGFRRSSVWMFSVCGYWFWCFSIFTFKGEREQKVLRIPQNRIWILSQPFRKNKKKKEITKTEHLGLC